MIFKTIGRVAVTALFVAIAAIVVWNIWIYYEVAPRTRDGRIRADIVTVASDVSGRVVELGIHDDQKVKKGDVLFQIDKARYGIAKEQAEASLQDAKATLAQAKRDLDRYKQLGNVATVQQREQAATTVVKSEAAVEQAKAALALARLNLERTTVRSPVNGIVTNLSLQAGDYVQAGSPATALVDSDSFYVVGYFEETKLSRIHVGDTARVIVMGEDDTMQGHVAGISRAITEPDRTTNAQLISGVSASFSWVRLAQRIPVRIEIDKKPDDLRLIAGRTASVDITQPKAE